MKRLIAPFAALAVVVFPFAAFAGDADVDVGYVVTEHPLIAIIGGTLPVVIRMLREDVGSFPSWASKYRLLVILGLSSIEGIVELVQHGSTLQAGAIATAVTAVPALFVEVLHLVFGPKKDDGSRPGGTGAIDLKNGEKKGGSVPPNPAAAMVGLSVAIVAGALVYGCATVDKGCRVIKAADGICDAIDIDLGDGQVERVPAAEMRKFGKQHRMSRMAAEKVERGGE